LNHELQVLTKLGFSVTIFTEPKIFLRLKKGLNKIDRLNFVLIWQNKNRPHEN